MKFYFEDFFSKSDQICSLLENFIFCAVLKAFFFILFRSMFFKLYVDFRDISACMFHISSCPLDLSFKLMSGYTGLPSTGDS